MVDITPPRGIQELWIESGDQKENVDMIVAKVLNEAHCYERKVVWIDIVVVAVSILFLGTILPGILRSHSLHRAGFVAMILYAGILVINLWAYWRFYRSVNAGPAPDAPAALYAEHYIRYQDLRVKFLTDTLRWGSILLSVSAILFAIDWAQGDGVVALFWSALEWITIPVGWWITRYETGKLKSRKAGLRDIRDASVQ